MENADVKTNDDSRGSASDEKQRTSEAHNDENAVLPLHDETDTAQKPHNSQESQKDEQEHVPWWRTLGAGRKRD